MRCTVVWLLGLVSAIACDGPQAEDRGLSNLVIVSIDTLRADHVGVYGYPHPTTPHIDAFARDSLVFRDGIAHAPSTLASHASLFTSLLPVHHGASIQSKSRLSPAVTTLTEVLRRAGYRTASWNGGIQLDPVYGLDIGFEVYESALPHSTEAELLAGKENRLEFAVARATTWLAKTPSPFFLFLHTYEIHHPYTPRPEDLEHFRGGYDGPLPDRTSVQLLREINAGARQLSAADRAHIIATYDAELRSADAAFGELLAMLRHLGLYDEALIVLTSDHGEEFGERGKMGWHGGHLFDELLRVPLIVKFPRSRFAGRVVEAPVPLIDVAPTLLGILELTEPASFAGRNQLPVLEAGLPLEGPTVAMLDGWRMHHLWVLRETRWKIHRGSSLVLYDLENDPNETENLAARQPEVARALSAKAEALIGEREQRAAVPVEPDDATLFPLRELGYLE